MLQRAMLKRLTASLLLTTAIVAGTSGCLLVPAPIPIAGPPVVVAPRPVVVAPAPVYGYGGYGHYRRGYGRPWGW